MDEPLLLSDKSDMESARPDSATEATFTCIGLGRQKKSIDGPLESLERFMRMGYSKEKVNHAFSEVSETSQYKEILSLWPAVLCRLREDLICGVHSKAETLTEDYPATSTAHTFSNGQVDLATKSNRMGPNWDGGNMPNLCSACSTSSSFSMRVCSSSVCGH